MERFDESYSELEGCIVREPESGDFVHGVRYTLSWLDDSRPFRITESRLDEALRAQDAKRATSPHGYVRGVLSELGVPVEDESIEFPNSPGLKFVAHPRGDLDDERVFVIAGGQYIEVESGERHCPEVFFDKGSKWVVVRVIDWAC